MGKKGSSSNSEAPAAKLTLTALLRFSSDYKNADPQCEELLGDMYCEILAGMSSGLKSNFRNGIATKQYRQAAAYLDKHPGIRDHILGIWKIWQPYPRSFSADILELLDTTDFGSAGSAQEVRDLTSWLRRCAESGDLHDRAQLLTTLTLLACTIGLWRDTAPLCLPKDFSAPSTGPLPQEAAILEQVRQAGDREDHQEVIRLLTGLIEQGQCRSSNLGAYHYQISLTWKELWKKTDDPGEKRNCNAQSRLALDKACECEHPEALLCAAKIELEQKALTSCWDHCERVVRVAPNTPTGGEACWLLYRLGKMDYAPQQRQKAAAGYLKLASQYGYPEAVRKYREENAVTLSEQLPRSRDTGTGVFCVNTDNEHARTLLSTKPESWVQSHGSMVEAPRDQLARNYFFLDDDYSRNLSHALRLLQSIKNSGAERADIAIYLRAREEQAVPLIDTALACLGDTVIPVRILDDDRLAARVLGYHPLYYPIRDLPMDAAAELNFIVIGDSRCCEWLVREAFWMTTFRNRKITSKITVLAPNAVGMVDRLMQHCPAMADAAERPDARSADPITRDFPLIQAFSCGYDSREFHNKLEELLACRNVYIAVDAGGDLQNMEMATFLREHSIRSVIQSGAIQPGSLPVITFRCMDTDIASLSRRTVVLNERSGDLWYNNYNLIPFGIVGEQYSWDGLTRDLVEDLSLDIHMVYCGIDPKEDRNSANWIDARNSYYNRSYNRDSSVAVALSMGYRLYQSNYEGCGRILPDFWDIRDTGAIFSEQGLIQLAEKLGTRPQTDDTVQSHWIDRNGNLKRDVLEGSCMAETQALAEWEHDRWNRFMISRGWLPASIGQMRTYMAAGNRRQQLYIGRLHPFICPFEDLAALEKELGKHIREYDIQNIRSTGPILTRQWTQPQRLLERSRERSDRERTR